MQLQDVHSFLLTVVRNQRNVLPSGAFDQARLRLLRVEEFGVATGGGILVAAGAVSARGSLISALQPQD